MNGQVTGKGFSSYQVNDALLANVVEAIKKGESDARRYSQLRSFEVYYEGYRERLVLGRIMIVPAKLADSPEDFPSALLYGAMVKEISPEAQADLYAYKLGESEFDEYDKRGLSDIKDKLFKDADGVLRSIIMFIPTWANVRDYVVFKMTRDFDLLTEMVRHLVFAAYYDPKYSSAFEHLSNDTEHLNVSEITPKLNYPGISEGLFKSFPNLEPGDGVTKTAGANKPRVLLAADTVDDISEKFLEPGEKAVIDNLAEELKGKITGEQETPAEVAKEAGRGAEQQTYVGWRNAVKKQCPTATFEGDKDICSAFDKEGGKDIGEWDGARGRIYSKESSVKEAGPKGPDFDRKRRLETSRGLADHYQCSDCGAAYPAKSGLSAHAQHCPGPKDGVDRSHHPKEASCTACESGDCHTHTKQAGAHTCKGCGTATKTAKYCGGTYCTKKWAATNGAAKEASTDDEGATTGLRSQPDYGESDSHTSQANELASKGAAAKTAAAERPVILKEGCKLIVRGAKFIAKAKTGHVETIRINGKKVKWTRPLQFTAAFRQAVETYVRNPNNHKVADVPQTFEEIWDEIAEPMGPAPVIELKDVPKTDGSASSERDSSTSTETSGPSRLEKLHERRGEDADGKPNKIEESKPVIEAESDKPEGDEDSKPDEGGFKPFVKKEKEASYPTKEPDLARLDALSQKHYDRPFVELDADQRKELREELAESGTKTASQKPNTGRQPNIGICASCKLGVWKHEGSEVAPGLVLHASCHDKAKQAAFNMYMPGQVIKEFYPELQAETVDFPGGQPAGSDDGFDPAIGLPGLSPTGVQQSADGVPGNGDKYISTKPSAAMGLGRDGKPQVLEGAPLRQENDIRGYQFDQEYYAQQQSLNPKAFVAAYAVERINKKASTEEFQAQFADFLKKAMGEIAASFIAAFKVTSRPLMNKVPGTGELRLDQVEVGNTPLPIGATDLASRVRFLMSKLTDSQIKDAINGAWAQSAVWNEDDNGGYTYEVFIRPDSIDKQTMVLKYEFVVGTKGL